jgi:transposase
MTKVTESFENNTVYVGLDVHKRSWNAAVYLNDQFVRNIHQPPTPQALHHYLTHTYPAPLMYALTRGQVWLLDTAPV